MLEIPRINILFQVFKKKSLGVGELLNGSKEGGSDEGNHIFNVHSEVVRKTISPSPVGERLSEQPYFQVNYPLCQVCPVVAQPKQPDN